MESVRESLKSNQSVHFAGNELMLFKRDFCNSCRVESTGDPDKFKVEKSIRKGIVNREVEDLHGVANLFVQMAAEDIKPETNYIFPKGLHDAIAICREEYHKNVVKPANEEKKRGYKSLHSSEYIETV